MAINISGISKSKVISSLDTYNHTAAATSMYYIKAELNEIPDSSVSVAIKLNGTTKATSPVPVIGQNHVMVQIVLSCTANDVISFVISSSAAVEAGPNQIKGILNIHQGSF